MQNEHSYIYKAQHFMCILCRRNYTGRNRAYYAARITAMLSKTPEQRKVQKETQFLFAFTRFRLPFMQPFLDHHSLSKNKIIQKAAKPLFQIINLDAATIKRLF